MKLGLDCDDVLADFVEGLPAVYNQRYGTSYSVRDFSPDFVHLQQVLGEQGYKNLEEMFLDELYVLEISPVPGAVEGVAALQNSGVELYVITNRVVAKNMDVNRKLTEKWLGKHFAGAFMEVIYAKATGRKKGEICRERDITLLVDDSFPNVLSVNEVGIPALLYDRHWNKEVPEGALVKRVKDWGEVVREVEKILQKD